MDHLLSMEKFNRQKKSMCKFIKPINLDFIPDVEVGTLFSFERIEFS